MHHEDLSHWQHEHDFTGANESGERRTRWVIALTFTAMIVEIAAGYAFGSMALLADGWHMASHAGALGLAAFAYWYARRHRDDRRFAFGTGKVNALGGFSSALLLVVVAALMAVESIDRWLNPVDIHFTEAIVVAVAGLLVNLVSALVLHGGPGHHHPHEDGHHHNHHHHHHHEHHDHNLRAAYLHVVADALTSVLAVVALVAGRFAGWSWMDAMMGIVGAVLITRWGVGLLRATSRILLDASVAPERVDELKRELEAIADARVADLHVWRLGDAKMAAVAAVVTHDDVSPSVFAEVAGRLGMAHVTVEVHRCSDAQEAA